MKLVDILARELKEWPDQYYQIYQDSGGYLHGALSNHDLEDSDQEDLPGAPASIAWDGNNAVVDRAEWQAAVDALDIPKFPSDNPKWTGEGLPPVWAVCEAGIPHVSGPDNERSVIWVEGRVIAYHAIKDKTYAWFAEGDGFYPPGVFEFRPIRTPEQIAAEERYNAVIEMQKSITGAPVVKPHDSFLYALYDAGYRKFEIVE